MVGIALRSLNAAGSLDLQDTLFNSLSPGLSCWAISHTVPSFYSQFLPGSIQFLPLVPIECRRLTINVVSFGEGVVSCSRNSPLHTGAQLLLHLLSSLCSGPHPSRKPLPSPTSPLRSPPQPPVSKREGALNSSQPPYSTIGIIAAFAGRSPAQVAAAARVELFPPPRVPPELPSHIRLPRVCQTPPQSPSPPRLFRTQAKAPLQSSRSLDLPSVLVSRFSPSAVVLRSRRACPLPQPCRTMSVLPV
jgi:hypothetical protein